MTNTILIFKFKSSKLTLERHKLIRQHGNNHIKYLTYVHEYISHQNNCISNDALVISGDMIVYSMSLSILLARIVGVASCKGD